MGICFHYQIKVHLNFNMLTLEQLKEMKPDTIFASGIGLITHPWFNDARKFLEDDGRSTKVKWVAVRGGIHDWSIYHSMHSNICTADYFDCACHLVASDEFIARAGAKLYEESRIREMVECTDEALAMYRT